MANRTPLLLNPNIPFAHNRLLQVLLTVFILFWIWMALWPTNRMQWMLENILVAAAVLLLALTYRAFPLTNRSYLLIVTFLCIHTFAAHYTYQQTPFDVWLKAAFHTQRSYFDRVVHLLFGLLLVVPAQEALIRLARLRRVWAYALPVSVILSMSAIFEILEMWVALVAGGAGQDYVGLQGDVFDSIKDIQMGFAGAVLTMGTIAWMKRRRSRQ